MRLEARGGFASFGHGKEATIVDFVDFDLIDRIVGVSPCHPHARTGVAVLMRTYEQRTPPAVFQVPLSPLYRANLEQISQSRPGPGLGVQVNGLKTF